VRAAKLATRERTNMHQTSILQSAFQHPFHHLFLGTPTDGAGRVMPNPARPAPEPSRMTQEELRELVLEIVG
jgi:hypothetical protein